MPARDSRPWSRWKFILLAVLVCDVAFVLVTAIFWVAWDHQKRERTAEALTAEEGLAIQRQETVRLPDGPSRIPPPSVTDGAGSRSDEGTPNQIVPPAERRFDPPTDPVRNAIIGQQKASAGALPGDDLFRDLLIPKLEIEIPPEGIAGLKRNPRTYVRSTIREGGIVYANVAIHLKGGPGSYQPLQNTPAFTLNFDKFTPGQTFHGLKKIHLNNSVQDRNYLSEKISRELFEAAGVPTPRAGHAKVTFNGRVMGMYVLVEGVNKQFLRRYFKDTGGNVYDGHSGSDVTDSLPTNSGDNPRDKTRLRALAAAAQQRDLPLRLAGLEQTLDLDRFLSFLAMEAILSHWDGYTMNRNNFRIFHDRDSNRMVFLPQGLDQILSRPQGSIFPQPVGLVARSVLEIPELRRRYLARVAQLSTNVFRVGPITDRINEVAQRISSVLAETDPQAATGYRQRAASFGRRFQQRAHTLQQQLYPAAAARFGNLAIAPLTDWQPRIDLGDARLAREEDAEGKPVLRISTTNGCTASWRTGRLLDRGSYRLEARLKTDGVIFPEDDPRAGAGLRISRHRVGQKHAGNREWTAVAFDFEVAEDDSDIELICELRALKGDVWFDLKSLQLRRR